MARIQRRTNPDAIRMMPKTIMGHVIMVYVVEDLENDELQRHFGRAFRRDDFEYMAALHAEAEARNLKLSINHAD